MGHQLVLVVIDDPHTKVIEQVESLIDRQMALVSSRFWVPLVVFDQCWRVEPKH